MQGVEPLINSTRRVIVAVTIALHTPRWGRMHGDNGKRIIAVKGSIYESRP